MREHLHVALSQLRALWSSHSHYYYSSSSHSHSRNAIHGQMVSAKRRQPRETAADALICCRFAASAQAGLRSRSLALPPHPSHANTGEYMNVCTRSRTCSWAVGFFSFTAISTVRLYDRSEARQFPSHCPAMRLRRRKGVKEGSSLKGIFMNTGVGRKALGGSCCSGMVAKQGRKWRKWTKEGA